MIWEKNTRVLEEPSLPAQPGGPAPRVVQVAIWPERHGGDGAILAVCEDGSLWAAEVKKGVMGYPPPEWNKLPEIPRE